ncbi:MAG: hypothetical protein A3I72_16105 [Candidatus Tectomicrobia bacterium RIFCSPLOWO2_02_FULL_70_19]|nr:MAG: hypothetical protein A3I72_16105 [Candidatus Tectomicrobia bacterium RIFCSPLOWO2_02_FULL_70_19]
MAARAPGAAPSHNEASVFRARRSAKFGPDWPADHPPRLTIDTSALNARGSVPAMNLIERWAGEGRVELFVPPEVLAEARAHRGRKGRAMYAAKARALDGGAGGKGGGEDRAGEKVRAGEMAAVLFPHTQPARLTPSQRRDARILALHRRTGNDAFITLDTRHFIQKGRRERLAARGIRVMTPAEFAAWAGERLGGAAP